MRGKIIAVFIFAGIIQFAQASTTGESDGYSFTRIDVNQGLSHNLVQCIYKDSKGFIWLGTNSGLNRYDGYSFKIFRHKPSDANSLTDNRIRGIFEDSFGKLWVSLMGSYIIYNPETEKFSTDDPIFHKNIEVPYNAISRIRQDDAGNIWFLSDQLGIFFYSAAGDSMIHLFHTENNDASIQNGGISSVSIDSQNNFWIIGFYGTLEKIDGQSFKVIYRTRFLQEFIPEQTSYQLFNDADNELWIYSTSSANGIYLFNPLTEKYSHFHSGSQKYRINTNIVNDIVQDDKGIIWVGTDHGGVNLIDKHYYSTRILQHDPDDKHSLSQNSVNELYKDNDGIIWIGTFKKGACYYHENLYKFKLYKHQPNNKNSLPYDDVNCFQEDEGGNLWIGTNGEGLCYFDRKKNTFSQFKHDADNSNSLSNDVIVSMLYDSHKVLWMGTFYGGLNRYDGKTFKHFRNDPKDPQSIGNDHVWSILEDSQGNLWIGTLGSGLDLFDKKTETFTHFRNADQNSGNSNFILHLTEDHEKNIWVGTARGIDIFNLNEKKLRHYENDPADSNSLSHNVVSWILEDSRGLIWIATQEGLNIFNKKTQHFQRFYSEEGLPDNTILSVLEDRIGTVWVSTSSGISNIRSIKRTDSGEYRLDFVNYFESDGLQGKEFNEGVAFKTSSGELIFGGPDGFNLVQPEKIVFNTKPPEVVFTGFQVFNKPIGINQKINGRIILSRSINETSTVTLKNFEDVISIEFAALNYIHPEKNRYQYILEGFNKDWMEPSGIERKATYTNLDPGEYIFRVRASNNDGIWNTEGISLKIIVKPPLWKTMGALIIYALILLAAMILLRKIILVNERIRFRNQQEKLEAKRRHELDLLKIRFFTNVSHEFRTPLSLIITPLEKMLKKTSDDHERSQLKLIYRNSKRLLNLVNQLLDFRRMEVQKISLKTSYGDLVKFIDEIYQTFSDLAEKKNILFAFQTPVKEYYTFFDPDKLEKIIFNLVSNAFKFTPEGKNIDISLAIVNKNADDKRLISSDEANRTGEIIIKVSDTGIGISPDKQDKIFDRFFQADLPGNLVNQGSGIGLSLTKEFVSLHNGTITVESEPGKGSTFTVALPILTDQSVVTVETVDIDQKLTGMEEEETKHATDFHQNQKNSLVLLVEDNDDFRFYLKDNLKLKYTVIEAADGNEGIAKAIANLPDLIVSDVMMPEADGFELCRQLKTNPITSHIPIILLTARMADQKKIEGYETGADDYITKPFNFEILESRIYNLIAQRDRMRKSFQKHFKIEPAEIGITSLDEKLINKALKLVEDNITDANFSVEKMSRELGMSRVHLYKKLTAITGKTPIEFIRIMRLKRAAQLLQKSQLTVAEVAFEVGFNDPRYFSRYFKTEFGILPSQYVKENKNSIETVNIMSDSETILKK
jgi:signal transduction histidine kinase/ligand-binding sensor domain-containing protein/DNA-binding response OmpR family regulator